MKRISMRMDPPPSLSASMAFGWRILEGTLVFLAQWHLPPAKNAQLRSWMTWTQCESSIVAIKANKQGWLGETVNQNTFLLISVTWGPSAHLPGIILMDWQTMKRALMPTRMMPSPCSSFCRRLCALPPPTPPPPNDVASSAGDDR